MLFGEKKPKMNCELMLTYDTPALRQTGSRNATKNGHTQNVCSMCIKINKVGKQEVGIWRVKKRFPQYGAPIWSLWPNIRFLPSIVAEKNVTKNVHTMYMFNVYKNQLSRLTGSRNLTGPKTLPTIWYTYMTLVTKYQISDINSYWEKCEENYLGRTDRGKTVYSPPPSESGGIKTCVCKQKVNTGVFCSSFSALT